MKEIGAIAESSFMERLREKLTAIEAVKPPPSVVDIEALCQEAGLREPDVLSVWVS